jgi:hypothetical protein
MSSSSFVFVALLFVVFVVFVDSAPHHPLTDSCSPESSQLKHREYVCINPAHLYFGHDPDLLPDQSPVQALSTCAGGREALGTLLKLLEAQLKMEFPFVIESAPALVDATLPPAERLALICQSLSLSRLLDQEDIEWIRSGIITRDRPAANSSPAKKDKAKTASKKAQRSRAAGAKANAPPAPQDVVINSRKTQEDSHPAPVCAPALAWQPTESPASMDVATPLSALLPPLVAANEFEQPPPFKPAAINKRKWRPHLLPSAETLMWSPGGPPGLMQARANNAHKGEPPLSPTDDECQAQLLRLLPAPGMTQSAGGPAHSVADLPQAFRESHPCPRHTDQHGIAAHLQLPAFGRDSSLPPMSAASLLLDGHSITESPIPTWLQGFVRTTQSPTCPEPRHSHSPFLAALPDTAGADRAWGGPALSSHLEDIELPETVTRMHAETVRNNPPTTLEATPNSDDWIFALLDSSIQTQLPADVAQMVTPHALAAPSQALESRDADLSPLAAGAPSPWQHLLNDSRWQMG